MAALLSLAATMMKIFHKRSNLRTAALALVLASLLVTAVSPATLLAVSGSAARDVYGSNASAQSGSEGSGMSPTPNPAPIAAVADAAAPASSVGVQPAGISPAAKSFNMPVPAADSTAPVIYGLTPTDYSITDSSVTLSANYYDPAPSVGIKQSTAMIHIDNVHQNGCSISDTGISCNKTGLSDGTHKIQAFICDNLYNCSNVMWHINVDTTAPVISNSLPTGTINSLNTTITSTFSDGAGAGVDPASASVKLDGAEATGCTITADGVSCPASSLAAGVHGVQVEVSDLIGHRATKNWSFTVDTASVGVSGQTPAADSWQTICSPEIKADFQQVGSIPIDTSSISIMVDGEDVSTSADRQTDRVSYTPSLPELSEGLHTVHISVSDTGGHTGHSDWSFSVDSIAPLIEAMAPTGTTATARPTISAAFTDDGSGIDQSSISLTIDGINQTGSAVLTGGNITYTPEEAFSAGSHNVQLIVADIAGGQQTTAWTFVAPQAQIPQRPAPVITTTRVISPTGYWMSYGSLPGIGSGNWLIAGFQAFPNVYYLPWYDSGPAGGILKNEIMLQNQGAGEASVNVLIGGASKWQGKIAEGGVSTVQLPETTGGPVKIVCPTGQPLQVKNRITGQNSVSETEALPEEALESTLILPWYETQPPGQSDSSLAIGNAGTQEAAVDVYIGDPGNPESLKWHYAIAPGAAARTQLKDASGGPVRIASTNNQPLVASLQSNDGGSVHETLATGLSRLGSKYSFEPSGGSGSATLANFPQGGSGPSTIHAGNANDRDLRLEIKIGDELLRDPGNPDNEYFTISRQSSQAIDLGSISGKRVEINCADCGLGEGIAVDGMS